MRPTVRPQGGDRVFLGITKAAGFSTFVLMALIGWCTLHGLPGVVAGGTGARVPRILGSITPGSGPLRLPEPASPIRSIRLHGGVT